ncbi:Capsular polysaccharide biosynthesis protein [Thermococcus camini]|uniref:Capsular polysaccharide biosynthesis protein n=1 Tax=Thermococcus camini TaxID=2016373 RepID=A0A7G2D3V6_9EURY|nr:flippase [Thermococcus camini]CAD5243169.1 Capsular polysaccharide biosynthesis protein [Thermococcus camini]
MGDTGNALHKVARGMGIVLAGTIASMFLTFLSRAIIARHFDRYQYGSFTLTMTVLSIAMTVALLGLQSGLPREISHHLRERKGKIPVLVSTGLTMALVASMVMTAATVLLAPYIAPLLNDRYLDTTLPLAAPALPFMVLTMLLIAVSRGHGRVRENLYYRNLLPPLLFLIILTAGLLAGAGYTFIFIAYVTAQVLSSALLVRESLRLGLLPRRLYLSRELARELFLFSLPLMLTGILDYVMGWTDSLMLGYYFDPDTVGLYNGAAPIARLLPLFLNSMGFLYMPIATAFFTGGDIDGLRKLYRTTTRWVFILTFPVFFFVFVFPESAINLFFGSKYTDAATALRILSAGFMFHVMMGLNGMSLISVGEPSANLTGNLFASAANVALNIVLIPIYGIEGAAVATSVSYVTANLYRTWWLHRKTGIHPFGGNYLKTLLPGLGLVGVTALLGINGGLLIAVAVTLVVYAGYAILILLLRTAEKEDIELLDAIEARTGVSLGPVKRLLSRFLSDE